MKLNYKRTILVGFAFFLICTFWQAYDTIIPKILTDRFGLPQAWSGLVMALDNILALFMLPLFGSLSDKCKTKIGKRKPFILAGTLVAVAAFVALTFADIAQLKMIKSVAVTDDPAALGVIYDNVADKTASTPEGAEFKLADKYTRESFSAVRSTVYQATVSGGQDVSYTVSATGEKVGYNIKYKTHIVSYNNTDFFFRDRATGEETAIEPVITVDGREIKLAEIGDKGEAGISAFAEVTNPSYTDYVVPARQLYIKTLTLNDPSHLIWFMAILLLVLVAMSTFRSPAVALMPDVTVKPLRSKANAVINLMGTLGGICVLVLGMGFAFNNSAISNTFRPYLGFFGTVGAIMLVALAVFMLTVREPQWSADMQKESARIGGENEVDDKSGERRLTRGELVSLILILASVALWYFGYNAVTSKYSVYATNVLDLDYSTTLLIANAAAVVSYIPVGFISSKIGRKKAILAGVVMLTAAFGVACFLRVGSSALIMNLMFALAGIGWATINVNSFPMVVELSSGSNIGKYTGYYYAASMAAQAMTPFFSGLLMDKFGMTVLFPYAAVFVALAFVTMLFVRHGDSRPLG